MSFVMQIVQEGDGTTFNRGMDPMAKWGGRWGELHLRKRFPLTWRFRIIGKRFLDVKRRWLGGPTNR